MADQSIHDVLKQEVLEYLGGSQAVLAKTVLDLTDKVKEGSDRVTIPYTSGYSKGDVPTNGSDASASGRSTSGSVLILDQVKQVYDYIGYAEGIQAANDLKENFLNAAPMEYVEMIEEIIAAKLATASANDQVSETSGTFTIDDISKAKKLLDQAKVPAKDRYMAVNAEGMEILAKMSEFQEGQKSLSPEALREGVVSQVKGFLVKQSEDITGTGATLKVHFYHKSAVAFGLQDKMQFIQEMKHSQGREFVALRGLFGCVDCDNASNNGVRKITLLCDGSAGA